MGIEELSALIKSRRSVYPSAYTGEVVDDEMIKTLLKNANWAPNHKKTEPWRFIVYKGEGKKALGDYLLSQYKEKTPEQEWSEIKMKKMVAKPLKSSHVIAICMKRDEMERLPEWEELAAVSCAVQNMWLSCSAMSLGSYWSSPSSVTKPNDFIPLEEGERCLGLFYIGVPVEGLPLDSSRGDVKNKTRWIES